MQVTSLFSISIGEMGNALEEISRKAIGPWCDGMESLAVPMEG